MPHAPFADVATAVTIQEGAIVSKVIHRDGGLDVTVFGFDEGQGLTEHRAARPAIIQVLSGRMRITADDEEYDAGPGFWLHMTASTPHAITTVRPSLMLLTLLPAGAPLADGIAD